LRKICICVCTAERPQMLEACLASLAALHLPSDCNVDLVVVDNNPVAEARDTVAALSARALFPVHYRHQPKPGIAVARNSAIEAALELNADWIAFIDDDETASPDWIVELLAATARHNVDIVEGTTHRRYPEPLPHFVLPFQPRHESDGARPPFACTNNVVFASWIVRPEHGDLRFDTRFDITGGEDIDFFLKARRLGAVIAHSPSAIVFETISPSRLTFRFQMAQQAAEAATTCVIASNKVHDSLTVAGCAVKAARRLAMGLGYLAVSPLCLILGLRSFEAAVVHGGRRIAWAIGAVRGFAGWPPAPYRRVERA
jgi:succinoglycan biosynthesis protein ExoM